MHTCNTRYCVDNIMEFDRDKTTHLVVTFILDMMNA